MCLDEGKMEELRDKLKHESWRTSEPCYLLPVG